MWFFLSQRSQNSGSRKTDTLWWEEKKLWAPRLQRKEEFFQFYFKKLEKQKPLSMASSQRHNPSLVGLARFVAGCISSTLRDPLSPTRQHFYSALSVHFKVPWGMVICFLTGWPSYFKSQLMFFVSISAMKLHKFWVVCPRTIFRWALLVLDAILQILRFFQNHIYHVTTEKPILFLSVKLLLVPI